MARFASSVEEHYRAIVRILYHRAWLVIHLFLQIARSNEGAGFAKGGGLGVLMGLFFGALDNPITTEEMTARQQIVYTAKQMGRRSISNAKTFAVMGLIFSAAECVIEKARAKHDTTNTAVAGCVTGGALAVKGGPKATCVGCVGFATFSVMIEKFFDRQT
ncbi:hypothetical protein E2562_018838 [Oryza meyeriana var. granulata]|uniref:Mitochondrial import inner membrane translocase subunit TIM22 n=1 Tax=Oryza meyeriana var. granulata TaxID=110450 RepID=A0A6G1F9R3_9ORYZ|nr:hypothetical protein E2562_018838 [Oryza meyeriana var. granulata]